MIRAAGRSVEIPWRVRRGQAAAYYSIPFAFALAYLAATSGTFQTVHRAIMGSFVAVIAYVVAAQLVNVTRLSVRGEQLVVEHGPLPWRGTISLPVADVRVLAVDTPSKRLRLRTMQGEEFDIVEGVTEKVGSAIDEAIRGELGIG